jgi:hypothetical protein
MQYVESHLPGVDERIKIMAVVGQRRVRGERREERVPIAVVDGGDEPAHDGVGGFLGTHAFSLVFWANGQRSPMPTCRMMPGPVKLSAAVVIQSSGVAFVQCTLSA